MPTPQRLPFVNGDDGQWGDILVQWLKKEHYDDGTDNSVNGGHQHITLRAGTTSAGTAPIKFSSGSLLTAAEAGAVEFLTDKIYFTITTGTVRKTIAIYDDSSGAAGDIYYRDSSGNFTRLAVGSNGTLLSVASGLPAWTTGTGIASLSSGVLSTVSAPSGTIVGTTDTQTLTNKRITKRTGTTTSSATPTINTDNVDFYSLTAQAVDITSFTTNLSGTPTEGQTLWIAITGTAARAITWGSSFEASTIALPTTTVTTNRLDIGFVWNTVTNKWRCVATA